MIALNLLEVKDCMAKLLLQKDFDSFLFIEGSITTSIQYELDGYLKKDYFSREEWETYEEKSQQYILWEDIRDHLMTIIKGKKTPLKFKFVLALSRENIDKLLAREDLTFDPKNLQGLYLNFQFENGKLECITGTSFHTFSLDKSMDILWDETAKKYLKQKEIIFEIL